MEIKAVNQNQSIKNIYIKNNGEWNKFETESSGSTNNKIVLNDDLKFAYTKSTSLDVSNYDVSNLTNLNYMFYNYEGSTIEGLEKWKTSKITSMYYTFYNCKNLVSIDLSSIDTSNVTNMNSFCSHCQSLINITPINFNNNTVDISQLFSGCTNLLEITLINTSGLENYYNAFSECVKLQKINCEFDFTNVTITSMMFYNNQELVEVRIKNLGQIDYSNSISFWASSKLSKESVLYLFNNAFDRASAKYQTFKIELHDNTKALLSEEEIAIATTKGFTII